MWFWADDPPRLADAERFLAAVREHARDWFDPASPVWVARAPGRLDVMGGIADYSGSLVLQLPLAVGTWVAAQAQAAPVAGVRTIAAELEGELQVEYPMGQLLPDAGPLTYADACVSLTADARRRWAAYALGGLVVLDRELHWRPFAAPLRGLRLLIWSQVPLGKGVSSSAALEVAAMRAILSASAHPADLAGRELALLCQLVENHVVGAPCGVMDQMTAACGRDGELLALLCQPAELQEPVPLPTNMEVWGIDSGIRHAVTGADYASVRVGAFMGYRIIAALAGLRVRTGEAGGRVAEQHAPGTSDRLEAARVRIDDSRFGGYLANVTPAVWEAEFRDCVPERMTGAEFIACYAGTPDAVTAVDPARSYAIRKPCAHPIYEHDRVRQFRDLLAAAAARGCGDRAALSDGELCVLGGLMYASHASYSACGLGSDGTDRLVDLVREAGSQRGLYGAKITGGGSGGTVAVLAARHSWSEIRRIAERYADETGRRPVVLGGSSAGALAFGTARLRWS